jgi:hypothetical protein
LLIFLTPYVIGPEHPRDVIESEPLERLRNEVMPGAEISGEQSPPAESEMEEQVSLAAEVGGRADKQDTTTSGASRP